jgi:hypothetical protein
VNENHKASQLATVLAPVLPDALRLQEPPDARWTQVLPLNDEFIVISVLHEVRHLARAALSQPTLEKISGNGMPVSPQLTRTLERSLERALSERECRSRSFLWLLLTADRHAFKVLMRRSGNLSRDVTDSSQGDVPTPRGTSAAHAQATTTEGTTAGGMTPPHRVKRRVRRKLRGATDRLFSREGAPGARPRLMAAWLSRQLIAIVLNGVIALVVCLSLLYYFGWDLQAWPDSAHTWLEFGLLKLFAIWAMSFLPGWLFVRFLGQRARALWWDFVLALHRLRVDHRRYLPEPPLNSHYYRLWREAGGSPLSNCDSIYQDKFDAYYGKQVSRIGAENQTTRIWSETLFPVVLLTAVLAVGWTAVLWDTSFARSPSGPLDMLKFGFLGAYAFIIQMLVRRYFQSDLRASAYASSVVRIFVVTIVVAVVYQLPGLQNNPRWEAVAAFVVGFFPIVGMQALQRLAATVLRTVVPSLSSPYPLDQIDGLNVWYEARLLEEGIEDMQNLTTTNLVDVLLHTHVPVGRLIDWIDQAHLYQHLDRTELNRKERRAAAKKSEASATPAATKHAAVQAGDDTKLPPDSGAPEDSEGVRSGTKTRHTLRTLGVRNATDLLKVLPLPLSADDRRWLDAHGLDAYAMEKLATALRNEPGLDMIWRWQQGTNVDSAERPPWPTATGTRLGYLSTLLSRRSSRDGRNGAAAPAAGRAPRAPSSTAPCEPTDAPPGTPSGSSA